MKVYLKMIFPLLGVSFCILISLSVSAAGQTWYDSEGRPLSMKDGKVIRGKASVKNTEETTVNPIIPKSLEIKPELNTVNSSMSYRHAPYRYGYQAYRGHYGYGSTSYRQGCYRSRSGGTGRGNVYLNYRRGGFSIRARY